MALADWLDRTFQPGSPALGFVADALMGAAMGAERGNLWGGVMQGVQGGEERRRQARLLSMQEELLGLKKGEAEDERERRRSLADAVARMQEEGTFDRKALVPHLALAGAYSTLPALLEEKVPNLETIVRGGETVSGYMTPQGFVEISSGPRWQPQAPATERVPTKNDWMVVATPDGGRTFVRADMLDPSAHLPVIEDSGGDKTAINFQVPGVGTVMSLDGGRTYRDPETGEARPMPGNAIRLGTETGYQSARTAQIEEAARRRLAEVAQNAGPPGTGEARSALPGGIDYSQATGTSGFVGNAANVIADAFGAGNLPAPQAARAAEALNNLQVRTQTAFRPTGWRPNVALMELIGKMTVEPNSLFQGDRRALERLRQFRQMAAEEIRNIDETVLSNAALFSQSARDEAMTNRAELVNLLRDYDQVLANFGPNSPGVRSASPESAAAPRRGGGQMSRNRPQAAQPAGAPAIGTVVGGYRYRGGNPRDPQSWEPVQ